jgi:alpha-galactosidase
MKPFLSILLALGSLLVPLQAADKKPLRIYILAGQSNMQGHAKISTFEHIGMDPATAPMQAEMTDKDGKPKVCEQVWISALG